MYKNNTSEYVLPIKFALPHARSAQSRLHDYLLNAIIVSHLLIFCTIHNKQISGERKRDSILKIVIILSAAILKFCTSENVMLVWQTIRRY